MERVNKQGTIDNLRSEIESHDDERSSLPEGLYETGEHWGVEDLEELLERVESGADEDIVKFAKEIKAESFLKMWTEQDQKNLDCAMSNIDDIIKDYLDEVIDPNIDEPQIEASLLLKLIALCEVYSHGYDSARNAEILKGVDRSLLLKETIGNQP